MYQGLTTKEAEEKLNTDGYNMLSQKKKNKPLKIFIGQFRDIMVLILLIATVISVLLGEVYDAVTIIIIVLLNAILGFVQEFRTEKTLEKLKGMTAPTARVYRDGKLKVIKAEELVVGDKIELETGDKVPADAVLLRANGVFADESILTGEAVAVMKQVGDVNDNDNSLNKDNIVYSGTNITAGHAVARVIEIGLNTQMGKISDMLSEIDEPQTPLQKRLGELGKVLAAICIGVCIVVFLAGVIRGEPVFDMLLTGITIAIAAIPEGLPATVTISLALAVNRMLKQKALVNKLHSVETLGCTSVICSDKTGTITENRMTVKSIFANMQIFDVTGTGYRITGEILYNGSNINPKSNTALMEALKCFVICNNASISTDSQINFRKRGSIESSGEWSISGDPTEVALLVAAAKGGVLDSSIWTDYTKETEIPFDSATKFMTVIVSGKAGERIAYTKGAADTIIPRCKYILLNNEVVPFNYSLKKQVEKQVIELSDKALRVLAVAKKEVPGTSGSPDTDMIFIGLTGMLDPPREEAKEAIRVCARSHIRTVMITGDHKNTAVAIAKQAGLLRGKEAITGAEIDNMSDEELLSKIDNYSVFARVNPSHKLRLVRIYKKKNHVVTMTGDGVNDAPAIKEADVGVAMGITGTDVTKEAADVILLDDNFATLVRAVEQGRSIYANIRKFVRYLLSCNIGEVITMFVGILMGLPMVMLPTQLLLVNLVTDGLPAIALGMEPFDKRVMSKPPRRTDESFFADGLLGKIVFRGIMIGLITLGCFTTILRMGGGVDAARTCALLTLVMSQLIHVFECKTDNGNIFTVPYFNNMKLIFAVLISCLVIFSAIYIPPLQIVFSTVALTSRQLWVSLAFSFVIPILNCIFNREKKSEQS